MNTPKKFVPEQLPIHPKDQEDFSVWGFNDTKFAFDRDGHVQLTGNRYSLCGQKLDKLVPWISDVMKVQVSPDSVNRPHYPPQIPAPRLNETFLNELKVKFQNAQIETNGEIRLRHGHGHTQFEMYAIKHEALPRVPDLVVYPESDEQVSGLVQAALKHDVCLIPYGGGTNVTEALLCPENEERTIVSVDMSRMNKVLWIDPENLTACIQAGAVGRHIFENLARYGFTIGHEPDSVEFSTLGGWVATHASGMKKNRYGNIEDIVLDMTVVTADGHLQRHGLAPRESIGIDARKLMFGSEGNLGIITSAVVKIFKLPEVKKYGSVIFKEFSDGVNFLKELTRSGNLPASVRLVDNMQFQFSMALKSQKTGFAALKSKLEKFLVTKIKGYHPQKMVALTLVFEGGSAEVEHQEKAVYQLAKKFGGLKAGAENGKRGYELTFGIAYIRDFVMDQYVIAESFETSVPWSQVLTLCEKVKERLYRECAERGLPGRPYVTCRVTQMYHTGAAVYFYFAFYYKGVANPSQVYAEIEAAARQEILDQGGSLSHHHGIGKLRERFLKQVKPDLELDLIQKAKDAFDPKNIFGVSNQKANASQQDSESLHHQTRRSA